jgi:thiol-disulfide isomerase/thioredoxin
LAACPPTTGVAVADSALAGITLPCLTGGEPVEVARLGRPTVINLWASWCGPCRVELPEFQRVADAAGDDLVVLGVVTEDSAAKAASLAADLGITFPSVLDETGQVQGAIGYTALPITLFVDGGGIVRHVYAGPTLTSPGLVDLVRTHLGVDLG